MVHNCKQNALFSERMFWLIYELPKMKKKIEFQGRNRSGGLKEVSKLVSLCISTYSCAKDLQMSAAAHTDVLTGNRCTASNVEKMNAIQMHMRQDEASYNMQGSSESYLGVLHRLSRGERWGGKQVYKKHTIKHKPHKVWRRIEGLLVKWRISELYMNALDFHKKASSDLNSLDRQKRKDVMLFSCVCQEQRH